MIFKATKRIIYKANKHGKNRFKFTIYHIFNENILTERNNNEERENGNGKWRNYVYNIDIGERGQQENQNKQEKEEDENAPNAISTGSMQQI